jgi:biotin operon repressor
MTTGKALEEYTDTDRTDHEVALATLRDELKGRGYEDRISGADLAAKVRVSQSTVYDLIQELRQEWGMAVYSRQGYFVIQSPERLDDVIEQINEEISTKQQTKQDLVRNFNRERYGNQ